MEGAPATRALIRVKCFAYPHPYRGSSVLFFSELLEEPVPPRCAAGPSSSFSVFALPRRRRFGSTPEELASAPGGRAFELDELEPLVVLPVLPASTRESSLSPGLLLLLLKASFD